MDARDIIISDLEQALEIARRVNAHILAYLIEMALAEAYHLPGNDRRVVRERKPD